MTPTRRRYLRDLAVTWMLVTACLVTAASVWQYRALDARIAELEMEVTVRDATIKGLQTLAYPNYRIGLLKAERSVCTAEVALLREQLRLAQLQQGTSE